MKALLLNDHIHHDEPFAVALRAAGYEIVRCCPPGAAAFPCVGISGRCPLDATVDVAVVVHDRDSTGIAAGEAGVICALRDGVPLVVAGRSAQSAFNGQAAAVAAGAGDVVGACERAVAAARRRDARELGGQVERDGDVVHLRLPEDATEADAIRAHRALRTTFPKARVIGVS